MSNILTCKAAELLDDAISQGKGKHVVITNRSGRRLLRKALTEYLTYRVIGGTLSIGVYWFLRDFCGLDLLQGDRMDRPPGNVTLAPDGRMAISHSP